MKLFKFKPYLRLFDNTNVTTSEGLSAEMRTYYSDLLIDNAQPNLVHDQFGQKVPIPKGSGKTVQFRRYKPFPKALVPLQEGVTPSGRSLEVVPLESTVSQYGDYVQLSDMLLLTAVDNNLVEAVTLLGNQSGLTLDTITREVLVGGTHVIYAGGVTSRSAIGSDMKLTSALVKMAARELKRMNAPKIGGCYVAVIHPDVTYDLTSDEEWIEANKYAGSTNIFEGEIGKIHGVRFVETTEAKIFDKAGASGIGVYGTLFLGANAYGVTEIEGGGLKTIIKQLGSAGTADPLDQRATAGWKATKTAERLVEEYMVRVESASSFSAAGSYEPN
ncbi:MAG: N4-gp56 family major capsid protein [Ruminococcaceae bacterium]|nr:N4-gp56 family major capsid protein [Oscillospiraceae bacterium]